MRYALTGEQTRAAEAAAVAEGASLSELMERAGAAVAAEVTARVPDGRVVVAAGKGNNGGDGWAAARLLHEAGRDVLVLSVAAPDALASPASDAYRAAEAAGVPWRPVESEVDAVLSLAGAAVVVDALLGIGAKGAPHGPYGELVTAIDDTDAFLLAVDVPSGVDADTGVVEGPAIAADVTVTFSAPKAGIVLAPGSAYAGETVVADIGVSARLLEPDAGMECWSWEDYADALPKPSVLDSKATRGHVLVIGGAPGMTGAARLAASAALRSGAGYVTVAVPEPSLPVIECALTAPVKRAIPAERDGAWLPGAVEAVLECAARADAVVLGPGLGRASSTVAAVRELVSRLPQPLVLDADALFALGADGLALVEARVWPTVLTPHAGEAGRLLDIGADAVGENRPASARSLARGDAVAVLKGPSTLVAARGRLAVNRTGGPGLATLGTGDVLAGMIGALLAQGVPSFDAAVLGAHLHGAAGDAASLELTPVCCTAEDVVAYLPEAFAPLL